MIHKSSRLTDVELKENPQKTAGYFGYGENTGSIGTVTINLPRIAREAVDEDDFYERLDRVMDITKRALLVKKKALSQFLSNALYPYTLRYIQNFDRYYGTFDFTGMNEACMLASWIGAPLFEQKSQIFAHQVLVHMKERIASYMEQEDALFNLEAAPSESACYQLAVKDDANVSYYTNGSELPVNFTDDVFEALSIQSQWLKEYTGGATFHVYLKEPIQSWQDCQNFVAQIQQKYDVPYFTISPSYSICDKDGYLEKTVTACPICEKETEIWARVAGYYQPINQWNIAKKQEFMERQNYIVK